MSQYPTVVGELLFVICFIHDYCRRSFIDWQDGDVGVIFEGGDGPFPIFQVLISLTPALSTVFILTYVSTRSIAHAIPFIVT